MNSLSARDRMLKNEAVEQYMYFPVVMFIMLYRVVQSVESVEEILKCDHSNENY